MTMVNPYSLFKLIIFKLLLYVYFLNQAHAWFLRIASVREHLYACVCVPAPEAINN